MNAKTLRSRLAALSMALLIVGAMAMSTTPVAAADPDPMQKCNEIGDRETGWLWVRVCADVESITEDVPTFFFGPQFDRECPLGEDTEPCVLIPVDVLSWLQPAGTTPVDVPTPDFGGTNAEVYPERISPILCAPAPQLCDLIQDVLSDVIEALSSQDTVISPASAGGDGIDGVVVTPADGESFYLGADFFG